MQLLINKCISYRSYKSLLMRIQNDLLGLKYSFLDLEEYPATSIKSRTYSNTKWFS